MRGFAAELHSALADRGRWLTERRLAEPTPTGEIAPKPDMMRSLRQAETERLVRDLSRHLNSTYIPAEPGVRISGVYERAITTPTGKLAVIRRQDTFTLAPWKPALEPLRGRACDRADRPCSRDLDSGSRTRLARTGMTRWRSWMALPWRSPFGRLYGIGKRPGWLVLNRPAAVTAGLAATWGRLKRIPPGRGRRQFWHASFPLFKSGLTHHRPMLLGRPTAHRAHK